MQKVIPQDAILIPERAERVFEGVIYDVYQWQQECFDGSLMKFEALHRQDTVLVIGIDEGQALIVTDHQPHQGSMVGFPGGRVDSTDQSTLAAAQREMREETGYEFANWRLIVVVQPSRKTEYFVYAYVAWGVTHRGEPRNDAGERVEVRSVDYETLLDETSAHELPEATSLLRRAGSIEGIIELPEFDGKLVDRVAKIERV